MKTFKNSALVALNDSISSQALIDFLGGISLLPEHWHISLIHFLRRQTASEELMGKNFALEQPVRMSAVLEKAKDKLIEKGFNPQNIEIDLIDEAYPTVADGIIDQVNKRGCNIVMIGRKKMSKAEEFVMGDISVKLIRALQGVAVLVVKSD